MYMSRTARKNRIRYERVKDDLSVILTVDKMSV